MVDGLMMLAFGLFRKVRLQWRACRVVRAVALRYGPIHDLIRPLPNAIGDYRLGQPDRFEYVRQLRRGDRVNRKVADGRPNDARYLVNPLLALLFVPPAWRMDRMNGSRCFREGRDGRIGGLIPGIAAGTGDLPVREGSFARFREGHQWKRPESHIPALPLYEQALHP